MNANSSTIHRNILGLCPSRRVKHVLGGSSLVYVGGIEVTYMLGSQPPPSGFLGRIIGHALKCFQYISRKRVDVCFSIKIFCRLCLADYSAPLFIAHWGFSSGIPFVRYDITPLPADAPPSPSEPTNHGNSRQAVVLRMRYKSRTDYCVLHFSSSFQRENIYTLLSSFLLSISYAFVHVFQVSKQGRVMSYFVLSSSRVIVRTCSY